MEQLHTLLPSDGVMSHFIDMSDHFAHMDESITVYNFLQYSRAEWKRIDNSIQPQNRLRYPFHKALIESIGFTTIEEIFWDYSLADLDKVHIHPELAEYAKEELAIVHAYIIAKK